MRQREYSHNADLTRARRDLVEVCKRMYDRGYIVSGDGNVSVRVGERRLLVTPSGKRKGFLKPEDMVLCDLAGTPVRGEKHVPSSEIAMHVTVYEERPDINAVVHAHPPIAIAHTVAGVSLATPLMPEAYCELGEVPTLPYSTPTTSEVPNALREPVKSCCALIMQRHGSITLGPTLAKAYDRLEILEHVAKISLMARTLSPTGEVQGLKSEQLAKLQTFLGCGLGC